jgi:hypothetical protein
VFAGPVKHVHSPKLIWRNKKEVLEEDRCHLSHYGGDGAFAGPIDLPDADRAPAFLQETDSCAS